MMNIPLLLLGLKMDSLFFIKTIFGSISYSLFAGGSSGGSDILAWVLQRKMPKINLGYAVLICDTAIIAVQSIIYNSIESGLYAAVALYLSTKAINLLTEGASVKSKTIYIISEKYAEISARIMDNLERGVTALQANGYVYG